MFTRVSTAQLQTSKSTVICCPAVSGLQVLPSIQARVVGQSSNYQGGREECQVSFFRTVHYGGQRFVLLQVPLLKTLYHQNYTLSALEAMPTRATARTMQHRLKNSRHVKA